MAGMKEPDLHTLKDSSKIEQNILLHFGVGAIRENRYK